MQFCMFNKYSFATFVDNCIVLYLGLSNLSPFKQLKKILACLQTFYVVIILNMFNFILEVI